MFKTYEIEYGGKPFVMEFGKMAKQTGGSCTVRYGETVVLVTACRAPKASIGVDFMPLTANYQEMTYAAGKIPGGFFKREGRPTEREVLCSRLIDRPIRPLFVDGYSHETQVVATVMSLDSEHPAEVAAMIGASVALGISDIPFCGPIACIRVGRIDGKFVANPSMSEFAGSDIDLLVAGSEGSIAMVEGGAEGASEADMVAALMFAQEAMKPMIELQKTIIAELGKDKLVIEPPKVDEDLKAKVKEISEAGLTEALNIPTKMERYARVAEVKAELIAALGEDYADREKEAKGLFGGLKSDIMRKTIISEKVRVDGRDPVTVRDITCEVGMLPRAHGSALFTRGETQAMVVTTLGTSDDEQRIDALLGWEYKSFMLHYNFPPWSVGEVRFLRGPGRREIGHGALAERAVVKVMPGEDAEFPYTMRVVSEIL
ncbi:MAG: polyribonucleotide nucleotidyltransferase, partial [Deltaproteobacteria bacterium]|nr:polyribonucleotide nucleotidyltransferase [Deltaproteobacteria bacterium]